MKPRETLEKAFEHRGIFLEVAELEQDLGLANNTVRTWICRGTCPFPYVKVRSCTRFRKSAVIDWLLLNEVDQTQATTTPENTIPTIRKKRGRPPKIRDLSREQHAS